MAKDDFMEGFLRGLYNSGVGNPEVQRQERTQQQSADTLKADQLKQSGQIPVPGTLPQDHPVRSKIQDFLGSVIGGGGSSKLASQYQPDPNFAKYYQTPQGQTGFVKGQQTPLPQGAVSVPPEKGPSLMAATGKQDRTNVSFDQAKSMATLMQQPNAFDTAIEQATKEGRDYLTKDEVGNAQKSISVGTWKERGDFYKQQAKLNQEKFELSKRVATYGGKMGQGQQAINTAIGHLGDAMDSMVKLGNTDVNALNRPINQIGKKNNNGEIIAAGINLTALHSELASAYKGAGATDQEIAQWESSLNTDLTPQQWLAAASKTSQLLESKISSFGYQQGLINPDVAGKSPLSPSAKSALDKIKSSSKKPSGGATHRWNPLTGKVEVIQ